MFYVLFFVSDEMKVFKIIHLCWQNKILTKSELLFKFLKFNKLFNKIFFFSNNFLAFVDCRKIALQTVQDWAKTNLNDLTQQLNASIKWSPSCSSFFHLKPFGKLKFILFNIL